MIVRRRAPSSGCSTRGRSWPQLPVEQAGVRIDLAGLAADDWHVVLAIDPGEGSRADARRVLARVLRRAGDPGSAYRLEWAR